MSRRYSLVQPDSFAGAARNEFDQRDSLQCLPQKEQKIVAPSHPLMLSQSLSRSGLIRDAGYVIEV